MAPEQPGAHARQGGRVDFDLSDDQAAIQSGIEQLLARHTGSPPAGQAAQYVQSETLDRDLSESGFLDLARQDGMGSLEAALLIEAVARLPFVVEVAASAMVAPMITQNDLPRPLALARAPLDGPIRFLLGQGSMIVDCGDCVRLLSGAACEIAPVEGSFAFPFARIVRADLNSAPVIGNLAPAVMRQWWQVALCFEIIGAAQAALDTAVEHVRTRRQFGKPLGAFQAIQHRLSECATLVHGARLMARYAAWSGEPGDAALAAGYAQDMAKRICYEAHQFHGAIGLTLEYPLHFWTYRLRILQGELGGATAQYRQVANQVWPDAA